MALSQMLRPEEVAERLNVNRITVLRLIQDGNLPAVNVARGSQRTRYRVDAAALERWIEQRALSGRNT